MASPAIFKGSFCKLEVTGIGYFSLVEVKGKNVMCNLCPGRKSLSASVASNSNLKKHLTSSHAVTQIVAKNAGDNISSATKGEDGAMTSKQLKLDWYIVQYYIDRTALLVKLFTFVRKKILQVSYSMSTSCEVV